MFNADQKYEKRNKKPKEYKLFIVLLIFMKIFFLHPLRKSLSETCITSKGGIKKI
jgi:hypothetical protein